MISPLARGGLVAVTGIGTAVGTSLAVGAAVDDSRPADFVSGMGSALIATTGAVVGVTLVAYGPSPARRYWGAALLGASAGQLNGVIAGGDRSWNDSATITIRII